MFDRDKILEGIKRLEPWWHCIDLGQGIKTKTSSLIGEPIDHPRDRWQVISQCLPTDLTGKMVLDVGCNSGFFSIEAKRRNAAYVLGIDAQRHEIMQANFVKHILNLDIEYRQINIYDLDPRTIGKFDVTLALGIVYHCKHLLLALEKLFLVTSELLIVDSSVLIDRLIPKNMDYQSGSLHENIYLLGYVEQSTRLRNENHANWFLPTASCLQAMLVDVGFDKADLIFHEGQRAILVCRKNLDYLDSRTSRGLSAKISVINGPTLCTPEDNLQFTIHIENIGCVKWLAPSGEADNQGIVWLGAHLFSDTSEIAWNYGGTGLECDLKPGENVVLQINLRAPSIPGRYYIEFDMVSENITWFQDSGSSPWIHELLVK